MRGEAVWINARALGDATAGGDETLQSASDEEEGYTLANRVESIGDVENGRRYIRGRGDVGRGEEKRCIGVIEGGGENDADSGLLAVRGRKR